MARLWPKPVGERQPRPPGEDLFHRIRARLLCKQARPPLAYGDEALRSLHQPMSIFHLVRQSTARPPAWLRAVFVSLLLAFAADSVAHVVHRHDDTAKTTLGAHGPACGYCAAFDGLIDAPKQSYSAVTATVCAGYVAPIVDRPVAFRPIVTAQPRAPPR